MANKDELRAKHKHTQKLYQQAIERSKGKSWLALCEEVDRDPWGRPYKIVMRKLMSHQNQLVPRDRKTVLRIVDTLFPKGEPRCTYSEECEVLVPPFRQHELTTALIRLKTGKAPGPDAIK